MSIVETFAAGPARPSPDEAEDDRAQAGVDAGELLTSPFAENELVDRGQLSTYPDGDSAAELLLTPFNEALSSYDEEELEQEAGRVLAAELEDEEFEDALEALTNEAAGRHLRALGSWSSEAEAHPAATVELEQWMEAIAREAEQRLTGLEQRFGDRTVASLTDVDLEAIEVGDETLASPIDAQERFVRKLFKKVKKAAGRVGKLVKKGVQGISKLLPLKKLWAALRRLIRPLLNRVLKRAIGKLPAAVRPAARKLAARLGLQGEDGPEAADGETGDESLATEFDDRLAQLLLAPDDIRAEAVAQEYEQEAAASGQADPVADLDRARSRLAEQLRAREPATSPVDEMEQFLPVVMAAMPLIRLGVKVVGRKRIVSFVAKLLAQLIKGMVGPQAATALSRHIADAGLRLLRLEAEADEAALGPEALVAAVEDTVREVFSMDPESLENELLLEAVVQDAFTGAALRHLPAAVLRQDLLQAEDEDDEHGVWVMMPRGQGRAYRYKKYSNVKPISISRPMARSLAFAEGDTLEDRLLESGAEHFPVQAELHLYETLPGAELGHLAAFEATEAETWGEGALEFEELTGKQRLPAAPRAPLGTRPRRPRQLAAAGPPAPGSRFYRLRVPGARLARRQGIGLAVDLTAARPELRVLVRLGERQAHLLASHLQRRRHVQVVAAMRRLLGPPARAALAVRLERTLTKRGVRLSPPAATSLADQLCDAVVRAVAEQLPKAAPALAGAAKDPAAGVTLTFAFSFASRAAIGTGRPEGAVLRIVPGLGDA